jgi:hypothetical protein
MSLSLNPANINQYRLSATLINLEDRLVNRLIACFQQPFTTVMHLKTLQLSN